MNKCVQDLFENPLRGEKAQMGGVHKKLEACQNVGINISSLSVFWMLWSLCEINH